jgi:hypothetical protein
MWNATFDSSYRGTSPPNAGIDAGRSARPALTAALGAARDLTTPGPDPRRGRAKASRLDGPGLKPD